MGVLDSIVQSIEFLFAHLRHLLDAYLVQEGSVNVIAAETLQAQTLWWNQPGAVIISLMCIFVLSFFALSTISR